LAKWRIYGNCAVVDAASFLSGNFGIVLAILGLVVCLVWIIFPFVAMNKLNEIHEELQQSNRYLANLTNERIATLPSSPFPTIMKVPTARIIPTARAIPANGIVAPPSVVPLKISKEGREFGLKDTTSIKVMLKRGDLTLKDRYFDTVTNEWVTLDCHPELNS
jgi:hypothetical protein